MARWRRQPEREVPVRLIEFIENDWQGATIRDRYQQWRACRHAYFAMHGEPCHALGGPNSEWGDFLDMMNRDIEVREALIATGRYSFADLGDLHGRL